MEDQENIKQEEKTLDVVIEEYEQKIQDMKLSHQQEIDTLNANHIREIRTIMQTGSSPEAEKIKQVEEEKPLDVQILEGLRKKYKLN